MSYDLMVFNHLKVPYGLQELRQWLGIHMGGDVLWDEPPAIFSSFLECMRKEFPPMGHCPDESLEYACDYEIHQDFVYMCFGYSVAKEAHDIAKRQARISNLAFWDMGQSFDRTFPVTLPGDKWPMHLEAGWIKYGGQFVYGYEQVRKVLVQMTIAERSSVCLTDRFGNYIQAGGYGDRFIVEVRRYVDAVVFQHMRADLKEGDSESDAWVSVNGFQISVPESQILSHSQGCLLFREFTDRTVPQDLKIFWKKLDYF